ncbi:hypothetical protein LCI18_014999 [Fusarium solani-melongenae]|uniref:Uncharacterized protein n=1 Tax=Fusarium solani subsp. cucurbitae TaxID=2747967 RepID=A0ACD3ZRR4_FUSSC|nr:hypothetical protein LCI18_014999 [Fusarium solani-melongenae]
MRLLPALALLAWANALADARGEYLERYDTDSIDCHDSNKNHEPRGVSALWDDDVCPHSSAAWNDDARDHGLVKRLRQWVRRADATTNAAAAQATEDDSKESDDAKAPAETKDAEETKEEPANTKAAETTQEEKPTEAEKTTEVKETKEPETTQKEETKEESTAEQPTVPSVTVPSPTLPTQTLPTETQSEDSATTEPSSSDEMTETSYISSDQVTYSTYSSEKIGASCFSTTVEHTTFCSTRTRNGNKETFSCAPANITSSACAPGMMCTIHPDSGNDVCMKLHNEVGTAGIIIASIFGFLGAACTFTMVFICYSDKRAAKKFKDRRPPKTSESTRLLAKAPTPPTPPALGH